MLRKPPVALPSFAIPLLLGLFVLASSDTASAYCRTRTCEFSNTQDCEVDAQGCSTVGTPATWATGCIPYAIQEDGSVDQSISAADIGELVRQGFEAWSNASCGGGGTPELTGVDRGNIGCDSVEFNCEAEADNNNIIVFRDGPSELPFQTIALSTIIANLRTGEILDVDIEMNSYLYQFDGTGDDPTDLAVVVNHEIGHLLGLSHSRELDSLMRVAYGADFSLGTDDEAGICASYSFGSSDPECSDIVALADNAECSGDITTCAAPVKTVAAGGCAFAPGGMPSLGGGSSGAWFAWLGLIGMFAAASRVAGSKRRG